MAKPANKPLAKAAKRKDRRGAPKGSFKQPPFVATPDQRKIVEIASACDWPQAMIAEELGISIDTLERHFREELDNGTKRAGSRLGTKLYEGALAGDAKKMEMWFDRRGGPDWAKKTRIEHTGADGGPIQYRDLSDEELDARLDALLSGDASTDQPTQH